MSLITGLVLFALPASAAPLDCKAPPDPDRPGTGLVGSLDPAPLGVGAPGSVYHEVGYAGQIWWTYDLGCGPGAARDPAAATDTWLGNQFFNLAKLVVGGVNWAHYLIERGSGLLQPLDGIVQAGTAAMYNAVFTTWVGLALIVLAAIMLVLAMRGDLSRQAQRAGIAVIALAVAAAAYAAPVRWSSVLDGVLLDGVTAMQRGFLSQVGVGDANTLPTVLTDQIVYNNWLRGEFGSADVPQARDMGRELLRAQTFTKQEIADGQDNQATADAKKQQFTAVADRAGDRYSYFQGRQGSRTGAGMLALIQAVCIGLFQLMSKLLILVSMLIIRLLVMIAPALAVVALLKPEVLPATLRVGGAALVNTLLVGAMAGLHSLMVIALFRPGSGVDTWLGLLVTGVVTIVLWALARPFRRLEAMVSLTRDQMSGVLPPAGSGMFSRFLPRSPARQDDWWSERRDAAGGGGDGWRPEGSTPSRTDPTVAAAAGADPAAPVRVDSERVGTRAGSTPGHDADPAAALAARTAAQRALPRGAGAVPGGAPRGDRDPTPARAQISDADRSLYRSVAAQTGEAGGPRRPVQAELVDGAPVYRIYRPSRPIGAGSSTRSSRSRPAPRPAGEGGAGADPD
ncbi:hypothetical protein EV188_1075 [Actinomycetospora succinea]|uniref:TrbL/VirB6 plasmid conjugal transfer protein n=3 Tax=Actinomycetospora succinea TaxID=663603 RepID=A0A4R6V3A7_9PSEU|nr:hypothetical protein [Actinomycetospora succinea]TDQ52629.1 hypothetical protein EV188_1075 [Actinomycetospora succinea]